MSPHKRLLLLAYSKRNGRNMEIKILLLALGKEQNYINALKYVGAIPTVYSKDVNSTEYDGLLLCGGSDIHPSYYGQEINGSVDINIERDRQEFTVLNEFINTGKPILGICRGCQLLNVALGGTLIQDLENKHIHSPVTTGDAVHRVNATSSCIMSNLYGDIFYVNSHHHQAIDKLGSGLIATLSCDGVIEAIEHKEKPYFAVQFHPERMMLNYKNDCFANGGKIFTYFVSLCKKHKK